MRVSTQNLITPSFQQPTKTTLHILGDDFHITFVMHVSFNIINLHKIFPRSLISLHPFLQSFSAQKTVGKQLEQAFKRAIQWIIIAKQDMVAYLPFLTVIVAPLIIKSNLCIAFSLSFRIKLLEIVQNEQIMEASWPLQQFQAILFRHEQPLLL